MPLKLLDYNRPDDRQSLAALTARLRDLLAAGSELADQVAAILQDVRRRRDDALVDYMRRWTDPAFSHDRIRVTPDQLDSAAQSLDPVFRDALARAIDHVRAYQTHILPADPPPVEIDHATLGLRFTPFASAGLHVPGGRAAYPSSVIMLAVPAQIAGVPDIALVSPPPTQNNSAPTSASGAGRGNGGDISPLVLGACHMLGLSTVYRIGGAQAIAALAFGTDSVAPVDFIAGPGNAFTQQAKRQLFGHVGIDGLFGPSEVVILIDDSARPELIAADLLAQAEHDPGCCFLVSTSTRALDAVLASLHQQLPHRLRRAAIEPALRDFSAAILVPDLSAAYHLIDSLAAEHVTLAVADPHAALANIRHGGAFFLSDTTPVASGDYYAGPSHCLPTSSTARFSSGLSVYSFLKRSSVEHYPNAPSPRAIDDIATLALAEGLDAHAHSARLRAKKS